MFKKLTEEEKDKKFLEDIQKVCKKWKRGLNPQIGIIRPEQKPKE